LRLYNLVLSFIFLWANMWTEYIGCKIRCQSWEGREPGKKERGLPVLEEFRVRL